MSFMQVSAPNNTSATSKKPRSASATEDELHSQALNVFCPTCPFTKDGIAISSVLKSSLVSMADPLSVAGLALGAVSLGLQVCGGVQSYLDGLDARSSEIEAASGQVAHIRTLLEAVLAITSKLQHQHAASSNIVESAVSTLSTEIKALEAMTNNLTECISKPGGFRSRLEDKTKKLTYPFHRSSLIQLQERLVRLSNSLQTAMQLLQLEVAAVADRKMSSLLSLLLPGDGIPNTQLNDLHLSSTTRRTALSREQIALGRLVSKPSYLGEITAVEETLAQISDQTDPEATRLRWLETAGYHSPCLCQERRSWSHSHRTWGSWIASSEVVVVQKHLPGCRFHGLSESEKKRTMTVGGISLGFLLNKAISLSLVINTGAGGISISPGFAYSPMVDQDASPAFQVMTLARRVMINTSRVDGNDTFAENLEIMELTADTLLRLFRTKRDFPRIVNTHGQSMMHRVIQMIVAMDYPNNLSNQYRRLGHKIVGELIASGVPAMQHDYRGKSPIGWSTTSLPGSHSSWGLVTQLLSADPGATLSVKPIPFDGPMKTRNIIQTSDIFRSSQAITDACLCGPLSGAIICRDVDRMRTMLAKDAEMVKESNLLKQTPLHLAVGSPDCLGLLLDSTPQAELNMIDMRHHTALDYAIFHRCQESASKLIGAGCAIHSNHHYLQGSDTAEMSMKLLVLQALKARREELKLLGLDHLPTSQARELGLLEDKVLDLWATRVIECLRDIHIHVPQRLEVQASFHRSGGNNFKSIYTYAYDLNLETYEMLWGLGFHDIDGPGEWGQPPLLEFLGGIIPEIETDRWMGGLEWLMDHGADPWKPLNSGSPSWSRYVPHQKNNWATSLTPAHYLCGRIGTLFPLHVSTGDKYSIPRAGQRLLARSPRDNCLCACSVRGCIPINILSKWLFAHKPSRRSPLPEYRGEATVRNTTESVAWALPGITASISSTLDYAGHEDMIRALTFEVLDMWHTCCDFSICNFGCIKLVSPEEAAEINDEQSERLEIFEQTVSELTDIFRQDRGGRPLGLADPDEFWNQHWLPMVTRVDKELNEAKLTHEEVRAAEEVGVVWQGPLPDDMRPKSPPMTRMDYFRLELNKIVSK